MLLLIFLMFVAVSNSQTLLEGERGNAINNIGGNNLRRKLSPRAIQNQIPHIPAESRIVGGSEVETGKYPFFVSWGGCGASLIGKDVILTAAHCEQNLSTNVRIGQYRKFGVTGRGIERNIVRRISHPKYSELTVNYDYMVMKLDEPVDIDIYPPIELNGNKDIPMNDQVLTVIGFGALSQGTASTPSQLQEVLVNYIPTEVCNDPSSYRGDINNETMLCAGVEGGGKDSCQGDSGGPIFYERQDDGIFEQVGIVSWGQGCALANYPGVYSRISGELDWIQAQICNLSDFKPIYCSGEGNGEENNSSPGGSTPLPPPAVPSPPEEDGTVAIRLDITYDRWIEEIAWKFEQNGKIVLSMSGLKQSKDGNERSYRLNLLPGNATFSITDSNNDGICCAFGNGGYKIVAETFVGDMPLATSNGEYQSGEVKNLNVPSIGSNYPISDEGTDDNEEEEGDYNNGNDTLAPMYVYSPYNPPQESLQPTPIIVPLPTISPTASPTTARTTSPTTNLDNKEDGKISIRLDITYDDYPREVSWRLEQGGIDVLSKDAGDITQGNSKQSYRVYMTPGYAKFTISDSSGDGICCGYGDGKYEIFVESPSTTENQNDDNNDISLLLSGDGKYNWIEERDFIVPSNISYGGGNATDPSMIIDHNDHPNIISSCVDTTDEFYVDTNAKDRNCDWLNVNMPRYGYLCAFLDVAFKCPKLCDACRYFES